MATYIWKQLCSEISKCFKESVRSQKTAWKFLQTKKLTSTKKITHFHLLRLGVYAFLQDWGNPHPLEIQLIQTTPPSSTKPATSSRKLEFKAFRPAWHRRKWHGIGRNRNTIIVSKNTHVSKFRLMISTTFPQKKCQHHFLHLFCSFVVAAYISTCISYHFWIHDHLQPTWKHSPTTPHTLDFTSFTCWTRVCGLRHPGMLFP